MTKSYCYFNGKVIPKDEAHISLTDLGLVRGYGLFEYLVTYNGKPFHLTEHYARLAKAAQHLGIKVPISQTALGQLVPQLLRKNKLPDSGIKLLLTGGYSPNGITHDTSTSTFFALPSQRPDYPTTLYEKGGVVITNEYQREFPFIKSTNYLNAIRLQPEQKRTKAIEILYTHNGNITECTRSNFFIFKDNTLITPKDDVLAGVTRAVALKLAKNKFKIEERPLLCSELAEASEAFLTSSDREIMPVVKVNSLTIGNGKVGPNTRQIITAFREYTKKY